MATMRWKNISLPIAQGVDTKTDSKALQPGKLANLENGVFTKGGSVIKRNGYDRLSNDVVSSTIPPTSAKGLYTKGNELLLADDERLLSYVPTTDEWRDRGRFKSMRIETETIVDRDDEQILGDCATNGGVTVYAWETNSSVMMSVVSEATGAVYQRPRTLSAAAFRPKVVAVGSAIHVYFYTTNGTGTLHRLIVSPANLAALDISLTSETVVSDLKSGAANCRYDVCTDDNNVFIAYYTSSSGADKLKLIKQTAGGNAVRDQAFNEDPSNAISICREPNTGVLSITFCDDGTVGLKHMFVDGAAFAATQLEIIADTDSGGSAVLNIASSFRRDPWAREDIYVLDLESTAEQYAEFAGSVSDDPLALRNDITIEAWIRFESLPTGGGSATFVARDENVFGKKGYYFRFTEGSPDQLQFACRDSGGNYETAAVTWDDPALDTWFHIAVVRQLDAGGGDGRVMFFKDGVALGVAVAISGDITVAQESSADLRIGSHNTATPNYFDGYISEVRIWDATRTVTEIYDDLRREITVTPSNLVGYWRFNNNYNDSSGSEITLTPVPGLASIIVFRDAVSAGFNYLAFTAATTETIYNDYPVVIFTEIDIAQDYNHEVHRYQISIHGTTYPGSVWKRHSGIASRAWTDQNDVHVNLVHASLLQTTYFTYLDDGITIGGALMGKMEPGVAGGIVTQSHLPNVQDLGNSHYQWTGGFRKRLDTTKSVPGATTATTNALYEAPGLKRFRMDYAYEQAHEMVQVGKTGYFNGGQLWQYDGSQIVEAGFHVYPENFTVATATGGLLEQDGSAATKYWYKVYASWMNANGERERSACAAPIEVSILAAPHANRTGQLTIQSIQHTNKFARLGLGTEIHFEVYRTEQNPTRDSPFYKVSGDDPSTITGNNRFVPNVMSSNTVSVFNDVLADSAIVSREVDYTNSGELDNIAPPAPLIIAEGKDRIWLAGFEDASEIVYSKQHFAGRPVDFNDTLRLTIPEDGGAITGLRIMGNNLVVFKEESIYAIPGDGPNNLGFGRFGAPQLVSNDVGCVNQRSLVDVPSGIMFQSRKGIYTLTKQYGVLYTGAPVEQYNSQTVMRGVLAADKNHVIFITDGRALLFDYLFKQWSTFTNHEGTSATFWDGTLCYGRTDGRVFRESATSKRDAGSRVVMRLETAWVKLNTLQGFQRIRRAMVLGEFKSNHRLALEIAYDYELIRRRLIFDATSNIDTTTFGDPASPAFLGDGTPFGSGTATDEMGTRVYQFRAHLPKQKCQSVKFYFEDMHSVGGYLGEGYEITELMLEVGIKRGTFKIADTRSI